MPVHKFITPKRKLSQSVEKTKIIPHGGVEFPPTRVRERIIVYTQKEMKIGCDPIMITLGMGAVIAQTPICISLPNELRHRRLGLINSIVVESCDDILVSIGLMPGPPFGTSLMGRRRRDASKAADAADDPFITIQKGTPLCILMM